MKIVQINQVCYGSTGKIAIGISRLLQENEIENYIYYTYGKSEYPLAKKYAKDGQTKVNALMSRIGGWYGFYSRQITKKLIRELERIKPDIVQIHNIHGHNVNLQLLFSYLKENHIKTVWAFHDCWAFTGYCTHFDFDGCDKWMTQCQNCMQYRRFSWFRDLSEKLYIKKKDLLENFQELVIVTPSQWMERLVQNSFLQKHRCEVIPNGIDLKVFHPNPGNFRERYGLIDKKVILGVAMGFGERKGYSHFLDLSKMIDDNTRIVLVGITPEQVKELPDNVIGIERTANQSELVQIYSSADVFVNCTLEDTFPTVNLEAMACGTPVVTFRTGGSPEMIYENTGIVVEQGDVQKVLEAIEKVGTKECRKECRSVAEEFFEEKKCFEKYLDMYQSLL